MRCFESLVLTPYSLLETLTTALFCVWFYKISVLGFGDIAGLEILDWSFAFAQPLTTLTICVVQVCSISFLYAPPML